MALAARRRKGLPAQREIKYTLLWHHPRQTRATSIVLDKQMSVAVTDIHIAMGGGKQTISSYVGFSHSVLYCSYCTKHFDFFFHSVTPLRVHWGKMIQKDVVFGGSRGLRGEIDLDSFSFSGNNTQRRLGDNAIKGSS